MKKQFKILMILMVLLIINPLKVQASISLNSNETTDLLLSDLIYDKKLTKGCESKNIDINSYPSFKKEVETYIKAEKLSSYNNISVVNNHLKNIKIMKVVKKSNGFKGAIFRESISKDKYRYRVVFCGSNDVKDWQNNIVEVVCNIFRIQRRDAKKLMEDALKYKNVSEIRVTGHSLGGFLTQSVANDIIDGRIKISRNIKINFTSFNAPGVYGKPGLEDLKEFENKKNLKDSRIKNYVIGGDLVGNFGKHLSIKQVFEYNNTLHHKKYHSLEHFYKYGIWNKANNFKKVQINSINKDSTKVSGNVGVSNASVTIYNGKNKIGSGKTSSNGSFNISIKKQRAGSKLTIKLSKEGYNNYSSNVNVLNKFSTFSIDDVKPSQTKITGKGTSNATVTAYVGNKKIGQSTVNKNGKYSISISSKSVNTVITVEIKKSGYVTDKKQIKVLNAFKNFTINNINKNSKQMKGNGTSGASVSAYVGNTKIGSSKVASNGTYSINIPKTAAGKTVVVKMSKSGYKTIEKSIKVLNVFDTLTVNKIRISSTTITGNCNKGLSANGMTIKAYSGIRCIGIAKINASKGTYSISIPKQDYGTVIRIEASKPGFETMSKSSTVHIF